MITITTTNNWSEKKSSKNNGYQSTMFCTGCLVIKKAPQKEETRTVNMLGQRHCLFQYTEISKWNKCDGRPLKISWTCQSFCWDIMKYSMWHLLLSTMTQFVTPWGWGNVGRMTFLGELFPHRSLKLLLKLKCENEKPVNQSLEMSRMLKTPCSCSPLAMKWPFFSSGLELPWIMLKVSGQLED